MKKRISALLSCLLAAAMLLSACSSNTGGSSTEGSEGTPPPADGEVLQEITYALQNKYDNIDPSKTTNTFAAYYLNNCFEGLLTYDMTTGEVVGGNAESWEISDDGLVYTFHLRKDLMWSDGSPLNANDYVYTIQRILTPETAANFLTFVTDYVLNAQEYYDGTATAEELGVKALDDNTLEITLKDPALFYLEVLNTWTYSPVQQATVEANGDTWTTNADTYICNGPFKITEMGEELIVLEKNEYYYDADKVTLEKITFRYIEDPSTALTAYERDEIQGSRTIPPSDGARLRVENAGVITSTAYSSVYYSINNEQAPFDNVLVRKALNLAIDRNNIINEVLQINATPSFSVVPPGYMVDGEEYSEGRSSFELSGDANPEAAQAALAEAGYPDGEGFPTLVLTYYTNENEKKVAEAVAEMFRQNLNIEVELYNEEWATLKPDKLATGNFMVARTGWSGDFLHPVNFLNILMSDNMSNYARYSNPEYDELVKQAKASGDAGEAFELMRQAENMASVDYPLICLYYRENAMLMKPYVEGVYLDAKDHFYLKNAVVVAH